MRGSQGHEGPKGVAGSPGKLKQNFLLPFTRLCFKYSKNQGLPGNQGEQGIAGPKVCYHVFESFRNSSMFSIFLCYGIG